MSENASRTPAATVLLDLLGGMNQAAMGLARKHRLVAEDGQLYCWQCNRLGALLPSLRCARCLAAHRQGIARQTASERLEHPEDRRWRLIFEDLSKRASLDRETAEKVVRRAEAFETATPERRSELWRILEARFGPSHQQSAPSWNGRGFRRSGTDD